MSLHNLFVNRLQVAFDELGPDTTIKPVKAFVLLKQSSLSNDDKKKVFTIASGVLEVGAVENAMRSLSTNVLLRAGIGEKKKAHPTNYIEPEEDPTMQQSFNQNPAMLTWHIQKMMILLQLKQWISLWPWGTPTPS